MAGFTGLMIFWTINASEMKIVYDRLELSYQKSEKITDDMEGLHKKVEQVVNRVKEGRLIDLEVNDIEKELEVIRKHVDDHRKDIYEQRSLIPKSQ